MGQTFEEDTIGGDDVPAFAENHIANDKRASWQAELGAAADSANSEGSIGLLVERGELALLLIIIGSGDANDDDNGAKDGGALEPAVAIVILEECAKHKRDGTGGAEDPQGGVVGGVFHNVKEALLGAFGDLIGSIKLATVGHISFRGFDAVGSRGAQRGQEALQPADGGEWALGA